MTLSEYLPILVFIIIGLVIGLVMLGAGSLLSKHNPYPEKNSPYECGFDAFESSRIPFDIRFYLVAILFIIFDLETAFFFPWAVSLRDIGLFGLFNGDCSTNQGFININPKEESLRYYILFNLKSRVEELIANASGATFKELSKRVFKRMSIVSPNASISTNFYNQVELFINQTENLEFQNQKLKAARDILLPRLMNRTIKV
jgi:NADH-quinone oxidoreductase subunit A